MTTALATSYARCRQVTRRTASNFYYAFLVLPRPKRRAMCALYAFSRLTDDLGDNPGPIEQRREALARWRRSLERGLLGDFDAPIFPALLDTIERYDLPVARLYELIDGVEMDLERSEYQTFDELRDYCYKVAATVGLCCIHIWGFRDPAAIEPAVQCGIAFQLTNILRDLKEDAAAGRVYLPQDELRRFGYSVDDLRRGVVDSRFRDLMRFQIARAEGFYRDAAALEQWLAPDGRLVFGAMTSIYRGLLDEIKRAEGDVFRRRIRLTAWRKLRLAGRWLFASPPHSTPPPMGAMPR